MNSAVPPIATRSVPRVFWSTTLPVVVLAVGGLVFLSLFAWAGSARALSGWNDFLPFYAGGRLAFTGHLYDQAQILTEEQRAGGASGENLHFIRPPWFAALLSPLAQFDYPRAYLIWEVLMAAAIGSFVLWWTPPGRVVNAVALCFSLPALASLLAGQDTPLLLAWMTLAMALSVRGRPLLAGLALGLCQTKFHLFLPLWLILIAGRRWRMMGGAAAGNAALTVVGFAVAGWRWPLDYLASIGRDAVTPGIEHMPTFYHALASLGLPGWWVAGPALLVGAMAWLAGTRLGPEAGIAIAPALVMPFLKHTYLFDGILLLPLLVMSVGLNSRALRCGSILLLTPIPWIACLVGYPWSLIAPAIVLSLTIIHLRLRLL